MEFYDFPYSFCSAYLINTASVNFAPSLNANSNTSDLDRLVYSQLQSLNFSKNFSCLSLTLCQNLLCGVLCNGLVLLIQKNYTIHLFADRCFHAITVR